MEEFKRGLDADFIKALNAEVEKDSWWKKIVDDKELFIGIRENYLNVYFNGASLLKLGYIGGNLIGETHFKYLLKGLRRHKSVDEYVNFKQGEFKQDWENVEIHPNIEGHLSEIKQTSELFQGKEKKGVHTIILENLNVIDTEIKIPGSGSQFDFAAFRKADNGLELVFYEAKHFSNSSIRARKEPEVIGQIRRYETALSEHTEEIQKSYRQVATNIAALEGYADRRSNLFNKIGNGDFEICPTVHLVIFGFDDPQKKAANAPDGVFVKLKKLLGKNRVLTKGDPKGFRQGIC